MRKLRLGTHQLPAAEAGLVRALVLLLDNDSNSELQWTFAAEAPFDALVANHELANPAPVPASGLPVLYLANPGQSATGDDVLVRPLRADLLRDWLLRTQQGLLAALPRTAPEPAAPQPVAIQAPARFKLRKWPPNEALRSDPTRIRMATMLGKRALSMTELANLSRQAEAHCEAFIQSLKRLELVDILPGTPVRVAVTPAAHGRPAPAPHHHHDNHSAQSPRDSRWGLVRSIRMRLGLR
ncbi:MAG: hypothetical protein KIS62_13805 [Ramlibacter sp.]|nr:hypothetical protein [Ramlibacter sp.]